MNKIDLLDQTEVRRSVQVARKSLRISNDESDLMGSVLILAPLLRDDPPSVATLKRFLAKSAARDTRQMLEALRRSDSSFTRIIWLREQFELLLSTGEVAPVPFVSGDDLTAEGFHPGPAFKNALNQVYDAQLEGRVVDRAGALQLAKELLGLKS